MRAGARRRTGAALLEDRGGGPDWDDRFLAERSVGSSSSMNFRRARNLHQRFLITLGWGAMRDDLNNHLACGEKRVMR